MHAPSEHSVDGSLYDAEVHLVHTYKDDGSYGAVIGVFFDRVHGGVEENPFLKSFFDSIDAADGTTEVDLSAFLDSVDMSRYWSYDGSFTTPPCTEGIKWTVIKQVQPISEE